MSGNLPSPGRAAEINQEHRKAHGSIKIGMQHAVNAGRILEEEKTRIPHGQWLEWIAENLEFPERTAQAYMRVARNVDKELSGSNPQRVADLSLGDLSFREALKKLSHPINPRPRIATTTGTPASRAAVRGQTPSSKDTPRAAGPSDAAQQHAPTAPLPQAEAGAPVSSPEGNGAGQEHVEHAGLAVPSTIAPSAEAARTVPPNAAGPTLFPAPTPSAAPMPSLHSWAVLRPWMQTLMDADTPTPTDLASELEGDDLQEAVAEVMDAIEYLRELEAALRAQHAAEVSRPPVLVDDDTSDDTSNELEELEL